MESYRYINLFSESYLVGEEQRVPWIAVSLLIPLDPMKELQTLTPFALNLATEVQSYLEQNVLSQLTSLPETKKEK